MCEINDNINFINAQQDRDFHHYKNITEKLKKNRASVWRGNV